MFVEFCDHDLGNSTFSWRNEPTAAVRSSHSTASNGCTPGRVKRRRTLKASAGRCDCVSVVCGDMFSMVLAISLGTDLCGGHQPSGKSLGGGLCTSSRTERRCGSGREGRVGVGRFSPAYSIETGVPEPLESAAIWGLQRPSRSQSVKSVQVVRVRKVNSRQAASTLGLRR